MWRGKKINKKSSDEEDMEGAMLGEKMERLKDLGTGGEGGLWYKAMKMESVATGGLPDLCLGEL